MRFSGLKGVKTTCSDSHQPQFPREAATVVQEGMAVAGITIVVELMLENCQFRHEKFVSNVGVQKNVLIEYLYLVM